MKVKYRKLKGWKYELLEEMVCPIDVPRMLMADNEYISLRNRYLKVRSRYAWDGPSGPTFDDPTNMRASLFHDALCQLIGEGLLDKKYRKYADQLFYEHLLEDGMGKWRAWLYYKAVRGWSRLKGM